MGDIRIGTSGYSYNDWKGLFYPRDLEPAKFLEYYAQYFDCIEIDSTYYRTPKPSTMEAITNKVPKTFRFAVKTPKYLHPSTGSVPEYAGTFQGSNEANG